MTSLAQLGTLLERLGRELQAQPEDHGLGFVDVDETSIATAVRAAVRAGALRGHRVGRRLLVATEELRRWIAAQPAGMGPATSGGPAAVLPEHTEAERVVDMVLARRRKR